LGKTWASWSFVTSLSTKWYKFLLYGGAATPDDSPFKQIINKVVVLDNLH